MQPKLASHVAVNRQFLRSVRVDTDLERLDAIEGYIFQASARDLLETTAKHISQTQQRGFTWTGAYGCGKSSLALLLGALAGGSSEIRKAARKVLNLSETSAAMQVFGNKVPWVVVPVMGKRASIAGEISHAIDKAKFSVRGAKPKGNGQRDVIAELVRAAEAQAKGGGVLLLIDELGKFLESASSKNEDIGFYQELAEAASRSSGKLVVVGILHQAFDQYALRLNKSAQEEWSKVQGRYIDTPLVAGSDEVLFLIGRAIQTNLEHKASYKFSSVIGNSIQKRRPSASSDLSNILDACWPLHPVTAALLGSASKRRFGQNERSVFGFLASSERLGFTDVISGLQASESAYYWPSVFWDYLRTNFEPSILASSDGHRWAITAEAVERTEARFSSLHVALVKTVGLIELLRNGSGLAAEEDVLLSSVECKSGNDIKTALKELGSASILIYRKHLGAWGVYAGSDFDIEEAVRDARTRIEAWDLTKLSSLLDMGPVTARRHYWETGAMRWFSRSFMRESDHKHQLSNHKIGGNACGEFVLLLPDEGADEINRPRDVKRTTQQLGLNGVVLGVPTNATRIEDLTGELIALEQVTNSPKVPDGDLVAKRELAARIALTKASLSDELRDAFSSADWYSNGVRLKTHGSLSKLASDIADELFPQTPKVHSELVNRNSLSTSASKAQRELLHAMVSSYRIAQLGYDSFSADAGLFHTVIKPLGLHGLQGDLWTFISPKNVSLEPAWNAAKELVFNQKEDKISLHQLYELWSGRPYGIKSGLLPIFALAFFLAYQNRLALYVEGVFTPDLTPAQVDEWLQDTHRIAWKKIQMGGSEKKLLQVLSDALSTRLGYSVSADALDAARALVSMVFDLPAWTKRTNSLSEQGKQIRTVLLRANDPHKVLFADLPTILNEKRPVQFSQQVAELIAELKGAFDTRLARIQKNLFVALDFDELEGIGFLHHRGKTVTGLGAEFRLEAFATRLGEYDLSANTIEGLLMLAIGKPSKDWTDNDVNAGEVQLLSWAQDFRRLETLAAVRGRPATRRAIGIVFGSEETISGSFDVSERDVEAIQGLTASLVAQVESGNVKREVLLAALANAGAHFFRPISNLKK
jgi:hypothetical protein